MPVLLREGFAFFDRLFDRADHVERLLRKIVVLAFHNLTETTNRIFELHVLTFQAGELCLQTTTPIRPLLQRSHTLTPLQLFRDRSLSWEFIQR